MAESNRGSWFYRLNHDLKETLEKELERKHIKPEKVPEFYKKVIDKIAPELASKVFSTLKMNMPTLLKENRRTRTTFEKKLYDLWKEPLDMLEAFLHLSIEIGDSVNKELRSTVTKKNSSLIDALTRLHGLSCLIGGEILTLLRSGYADGANARWRSLHEVAVIASFVQEKGNEVAERYLKHNAIESYKGLKEYQEYAKSLKLTPLSSREIQEISKERKQLIEKYGNSYKKTYGWASSSLGIENPTLRDIERSVKLDHLRPYYRMASHHVHTNPKSILFKLGQSYWSEEIILAGPSDAGLADPGQGMAISLNQVNSVLLAVKPSVMVIVVLKVMAMWVEELCNKFIQVHRCMQDRS